LLEQTGSTNEALQAFSKAIDLASGHTNGVRTEALRRRYNLLKRLGRFAEAQAELLRAKNIPPRNPELSPNLIDLSPHYNAGLDQPLHTKANSGNNLSALPRGLQTLADVQFDVRGLVQLSSSSLKKLDPDAGYPEQVNGIKVARQCRRLHFLHASGIAVADGVQIASYIVHYANGRQHEICIVYGENVRDWWVVSNEAKAPQQLQVAWTGSNAATPRIRLFKTTWANPLPDLEVRTIDYVSKMTSAAPFLVALTVE
jgi:tetratricopeptide (TPR) repeat protein